MPAPLHRPPPSPSPACPPRNWENLPACPLISRELADMGYLRDRLSYLLGIQPMGEMSAAALAATVRLNRRRMPE